MATSKAKKPFHLIRITKEIFNDLMIWKMFVENFNGTSFILDDTWLSNFDMQLFTDSAGGIGKGCGCYLFGKWSILQWPVEWYHADILKDITFLEMIHTRHRPVSDDIKVCRTIIANATPHNNMAFIESAMFSYPPVPKPSVLLSPNSCVTIKKI